MHWERLARVNPTHILVQSSPAMVNPALTALAERRDWQVMAHPLVGTDDIRSAMQVLPDQLALPPIDAGVARNRADGFEQMIEQILSQGPVLDGDRVLIVSPMEPPLAWGTDTYLGQILEGFGASNTPPIAGWSPIGFEDVVRCRTDRVLVVASYEPDPTHPLFIALDQLPEQVTVDTLVHPALNLPATNLPAIMRTMRATLGQRGCRNEPPCPKSRMHLPGGHRSVRASAAHRSSPGGSLGLAWPDATWIEFRRTAVLAAAIVGARCAGRCAPADDARNPLASPFILGVSSGAGLA